MAAVLLWAPAEAGATDVHVYFGGSGRGDDYAVLEIVAGDGRNRISVIKDGGRYIVTDRGETLSARRGCRLVDAHSARCRLPTFDNPSDIQVFGRGGADRIKLGASVPDDVEGKLEGGDGRDRISGGPGRDFIFGGRGRDRAIGGAGEDRVAGDQGEDVLLGGAGDDIVDAGLPDGLHGEPDRLIDCGDGAADRALVDRDDPMPDSCESVEEVRTGKG